MNNITLIVMIGLTGGAFIGLQAPLSSMIARQLGILESVFIIHFGGAVISLIILLMMKGGSLGEWRSLPWYSLAAGVFGVLFISAFTFLVPRIGVTSAIILTVAGQLAIASFIDHFGLLSVEVKKFDIQRLTGIVIVFLGVWQTIR